VAQGVRTHAPHAHVAIALIDDAALAFVFDVGQRQLFAQDARQLVERDLDLQRVLAGALARLLALTGLRLALAKRIPRVALALSHATLLVAVAKARDVDLRNRNGNYILALAAQQLTLGDVLAQILADFTANDMAEAPVILVDLQGHATPVYPHGSVGGSKMLGAAQGASSAPGQKR